MEKKAYYSGLDLLKGVFAFFIAFVFHYYILFQARPFGDNAIMNFAYTWGGYFVEIFFMISGFVAHYNYSSAIQSGELNVNQFFYKRVVALYPAMILSVICAAVGQWISMWNYGTVLTLEGPYRNSLESFILSILGVQTGWFGDGDYYSINGPTWYICILMICYGIYFLILRASSKNVDREKYMLMGMVLLGTYLYIHPFEFPLLYLSCGRGYLSFFGGVLLAKCCKLEVVKKHRKRFLVGACLLLVLFAVMYDRRNLGHTYWAISYVMNPALVYIFVQSKVIDKACNNRIVRGIGKLSFYVYLYNIPITIWLYYLMRRFSLEFDFSTPAIWGMYIIGSIIISAMCYKVTTWIESYIKCVRLSSLYRTSDE